MIRKRTGWKEKLGNGALQKVKKRERKFGY